MKELSQKRQSHLLCLRPEALKQSSDTNMKIVFFTVKFFFKASECASFNPAIHLAANFKNFETISQGFLTTAERTEFWVYCMQGIVGDIRIHHRYIGGPNNLTCSMFGSCDEKTDPLRLAFAFAKLISARFELTMPNNNNGCFSIIEGDRHTYSFENVSSRFIPGSIEFLAKISPIMNPKIYAGFTISPERRTMLEHIYSLQYLYYENMRLFLGFPSSQTLQIGPGKTPTVATTRPTNVTETSLTPPVVSASAPVVTPSTVSLVSLPESVAKNIQITQQTTVYKPIAKKGFAPFEKNKKPDDVGPTRVSSPIVEDVPMTPQEQSFPAERIMSPISFPHNPVSPAFLPKISKTTLLTPITILRPYGPKKLSENELRIRHTHALYKFTEKRTSAAHAKNVVKYIRRVGSLLETVLNKNTALRYTTLFSSGLITYEEMKNLLALSPYRNVDISDYRKALGEEFTEEQLNQLLETTEAVSE